MDRWPGRYWWGEALTSECFCPCVPVIAATWQNGRKQPLCYAQRLCGWGISKQQDGLLSLTMSGFSLGRDFTAWGWNCGLAGMPWGFWGLRWALTCPHSSHTHGFSTWPLRGLVWASSQDGSWFQEQASQERKVELHNSLFNLINHTASFLPHSGDWDSHPTLSKFRGGTYDGKNAKINHVVWRSLGKKNTVCHFGKYHLPSWVKS